MHALSESGHAVPQGERKADTLMLVRNPGQPIFTPAIDARTRVVVREILPGIAIGGVVFAHRTPCAFAKVRSPAAPSERAPRLRHRAAVALALYVLFTDFFGLVGIRFFPDELRPFSYIRCAAVAARDCSRLATMKDSATITASSF